MKKRLKNLFSRSREIDPQAPETPVGGANIPPAADALLEQQKENQALRIELQEREKEVQALRQEIERLRYRQDQQITESLNARLKNIFDDLSGPASQILTLDYLYEEEQKPLQVGDVLAVARRMVRSLERHGLVFEGKVGEQVIYDPNRHTPVGDRHLTTAGQSVTVRFAGTSFAGETIRKAGIE